MPDGVSSSVGTWMGPIAGGAVSGAGSLLASAINVREARKSREWQERMSNTSYQRAVKDMRAAGINPMVAFSKGGASTPGGATASSAGNPLEGLGEGISSATKLNKVDIPLVNAQAASALASARKTAEEAESVRVSRQQSVARFQMDLDELRSRIANLGANTGLTQASTGQQELLSALAGITKQALDYFTKGGATLSDPAMNKVFGAVDSLGKFPELVKGAPQKLKSDLSTWAAGKLAGPGGALKPPTSKAPGYLQLGPKPSDGSRVVKPWDRSRSEMFLDWLMQMGNAQLLKDLTPSTMGPRGDIVPHVNRNVRPGETNGGRNSARSHKR